MPHPPRSPQPPAEAGGEEQLALLKGLKCLRELRLGWGAYDDSVIYAVSDCPKLEARVAQFAATPWGTSHCAAAAADRPPHRLPQPAPVHTHTHTHTHPHPPPPQLFHLTEWDQWLFRSGADPGVVGALVRREPYVNGGVYEDLATLSGLRSLRLDRVYLDEPEELLCFTLLAGARRRRPLGSRGSGLQMLARGDEGATVVARSLPPARLPHCGPVVRRFRCLPTASSARPLPARLAPAPCCVPPPPGRPHRAAAVKF